MVSATTATRQARRTERARTQAADYTVRPVFDNGVTYWVTHNTTHKRYFVQHGVCDCADFQKCGRRRDGSLTGLECKHLLLAKQAMNFTDEPLPTDETDPSDTYHLSADEPAFEDPDEWLAGIEADRAFIEEAKAQRAQALRDRELWD